MEYQPIGRKICCCEAKLWTKIIGWIQTVEFFLATLSFFHFVVVGSFTGMSPESGLEIILGFLVIVLILMMLIMGAAMGVCLLIGAYGGNTDYLTNWINYACFSLSLYIILPAGDYFFNYISSYQNTFSVIPYVVGAGCQAFFIWVVSIHRSELEICKHDMGEAYEI
ncbi:unnamed protein product [Allacma fusca]|uniref:Uncharacterized protein n=1 Tax=Allacma fusca TaxID=39272 RepID=A0A8J2P3C0_9HEXA|nr:unnamed protein product [Allacma fusca]